MKRIWLAWLVFGLCTAAMLVIMAWGSRKLVQLDANTIVPGHEPILHDKAYVLLVRDLLKSAVDLSAFRPRFAGADKDLEAEFDDMASNLIKVVFTEASLR